MKTVCVLTLGWLLFDSELSLKNVTGMALAVTGMVLYSWAVETEKRTNYKFIPTMKNSISAEEVELLKQETEEARIY